MKNLKTLKVLTFSNTQALKYIFFPVANNNRLVVKLFGDFFQIRHCLTCLLISDVSKVSKND